MILKQIPEDFRVEELTDLQPAAGPFSLYKLEKSDWTTPDALAAVRRRWQLDQRRLSFGGLKDRHAQTLQYFSVFHGPQRKLTHQGFAVTYLGQIAEPYVSHHIRANRFQLVLRDVAREEVAGFAQLFEEVRSWGVPNYFDDQRFGSVTPAETDAGEPAPPPQFVAKSIILGRYEEALQLALIARYPHDRGPQKREKAALRAHWGDWAKCVGVLPRGHARDLAGYLAGHPDDFRGALVRLRPELRGLYLSAYQSHLWNRMLAAWLQDHVPAPHLEQVRLKLGAVPMHRVLDQASLETLRNLLLPLPTHHVQLDDADPRRLYVEKVLREEGLTLEQLKLKGLRELFFSRGERAALLLPANLNFAPSPDETHAGKLKLTLTFDLPRGCYATLLIKRLTSAEDPE